MATGANGRAQGRPNLLPAGSPPVRPYVLAQILADVGASPTDLSERTVRRIKRSFPIPVEQEVVWADVEFGTRTHGLVLTDAGVFLKDGPSDDGDADDSGDAAGIEVDGLGFSYVRWESFDVARVSHVDGAPTLDKARFLDGRPFKSFAMACVRINNRRVRMRNAGRRLARSEGLFAPDGPVRSVCRSTAAASVSFCFDKDGEYKFVDDDGLPVAMEVPFDQYDAALQRMRKKIEEGCIRPLDDPNYAGVLVRCGWYTRTQAVNMAKTGTVPHTEYRGQTGSVVCRDPKGLGHWLSTWLRAREAFALRICDQSAAEEEGERALMVQEGVSQALAAGALVREEHAAPKGQAMGKKLGKMVATNAASQASFAVGATGARVLMTAVGAATGPLGFVASLALGQVCGKAGMEAFSMVKDMFVEPRERIYERLFGSVFANVSFEYALTPTEQSLLTELMAHIAPEQYQRLGAVVSEAEAQEGEIRSFLTPLIKMLREGGRPRRR